MVQQVQRVGSQVESQQKEHAFGLLRDRRSGGTSVRRSRCNLRPLAELPAGRLPADVAGQLEVSGRELEHSGKTMESAGGHRRKTAAFGLLSTRRRSCAEIRRSGSESQTTWQTLALRKFVGGWRCSSSGGGGGGCGWNT